MADAMNTYKSRILDGADLLRVTENDIKKSISPGFLSDWGDSIRHNHGKHNALISTFFSVVGFGILYILWNYVTFAATEVVTTTVVICGFLALVGLISFLGSVFDACGEVVIASIICEAIVIPIIYNLAQIPENALPSCGVGNVFRVVGFCVSVIGYLLMLIYTTGSIIESRPTYQIRCSSIRYRDLKSQSVFDNLGIMLPENIFHRIVSIFESGKYGAFEWVNIHYAYYNHGNKIAPDFMVTIQDGDGYWCVGFIQQSAPSVIVDGNAIPVLTDADKRHILDELKKTAKRRTED